jgi:AcrR family transcriptional regulator
MQPTMSTKREKRHLRTRQAILDAARTIIAEEGPAALSMRALADRIDYSAGGLYEYFGGKEEIIAAVCGQGQQYLYDAMNAVDPALSPVEYLHQIGLAYIRFALEHPDYFLLMFTTAPAPNMAETPGEAVLAQLHGEGSAYGLLVQAIRRGIDAGVFAVRAGFDQDEMTYAAWSVVHGIAMLRTTALRHYPLDLAAADEQVLRNFVRGLRGN